MLIGDGVIPGNEGRGYVLRRMMRRTIRNMRLLGAADRNTKDLIESSIEAMGPQYPELKIDKERIIKIAQAEEEAFLSTLKRNADFRPSAQFAQRNRRNCYFR
jgi:alanyl-tRNA synthetase